MIHALTTLLLFQLTGEVLAHLLQLTVPGPVIGMALLFLSLMLRGGPSAELRQTSSHLLQHLSLLFVPAGTGIMLYGDRLAKEWLPLTVAVLVSTVLAIAVSGWVLQRLTKRRQAHHREPKP